jgi:hypothetical protein
VCTLILGVDLLGPGTLLVGANRDESPGRPSAGPARLRGRPPVAGGRDLTAGGTWLAVREGRFVAAILNRRPPAGPLPDPATLRSRGLLCLDAATMGPPFDAPAALDPATGEAYPARLDAALRLAARDRYAPCTLVGLEAGGASWAVSIGPERDRAPRATLIGPGWHVVTHADLDDEGEPRTRALLADLRGMAPSDADDALDLLAARLRGHGDAGAPPVCLHRERFPTVSSTLLALGRGLEPRYRHAAGPPCTTPYDDFDALLATGAVGAPEEPR